MPRVQSGHAQVRAIRDSVIKIRTACDKLVEAIDELYILDTVNELPSATQNPKEGSVDNGKGNSQGGEEGGEPGKSEGNADQARAAAD